MWFERGWGKKCEVLYNLGRLIFNSPCLLRVPGGKAVSALCDLELLLPLERGENKAMNFIFYCRLPQTDELRLKHVSSSIKTDIF